MSAMGSQITGVSSVCSTDVQAQIKEDINAPRHLPLWGESTGDRRIPLIRASNMEVFSIWWRHHDLVKYSNLWMNIKQIDNRVFQILDTQISESRMI